MASNGHGHARRRSPSRARRARRRRHRWRSGSSGRSPPTSSPPQAVGQNPMPTRPPRGGDAAQVRVGQVAGVVGDAADARCARRRPAGSHGQDVVDGGGRGMGDVDEHPRAPPSARSSRGRPRSGRPSRRRARSRRRRCRRSGSATSSGSPASATTSTLAGSSSSAWAPSIASRPAVTGRLGARRARWAARSACERMIVKRPAGAARHRVGPRRPCAAPGRAGSARSRGGQPRADRQQDDVVAAVVVALDVEVARRLGARGEDLERDVALDEARDVDVAAVAALAAGRGPTAASRRAGRRRRASRAGPAPAPMAGSGRRSGSGRAAARSAPPAGGRRRGP